MNDRKKLLKKLRKSDQDYFGASLNCYQPFVQASWLDRLSTTTLLRDKDLEHPIK